MSPTRNAAQNLIPARSAHFLAGRAQKKNRSGRKGRGSLSLTRHPLFEREPRWVRDVQRVGFIP